MRRIAADPLLWEQHPSKDRADPVVFRQWMDDALAAGGSLTVIDRASGEIVGSSRYALHGDDIEIGWTFVARSHWGDGTNTELKRLMLDHAFQSVPSVVFLVHSDNHRSQRAVEKLGAVRVGTETDALGRGENVVFRLDRP